MYLKVGETAEVQGKKIKCVETPNDEHPCNLCCYRLIVCAHAPECISNRRADNKIVHFENVK